jgi:3-oxoacyl-[acyl-carrier protein] reductase
MVRARRGGRIVTLSSVAGISGNRGQTNYAASKAGLIGATKSLALELASRQITVNCVAPGWVETEMLEGADLRALASLVPLQRLGTPEDVASAVGFLFSPGAAYITAQVLSVNGGIR